MAPAGIRGAVPLAFTLLLTSCSMPEGLVFIEDDRLTFSEPSERSTVTLPVSVAWTMKDFQVSTARQEGEGSFVAFVDRAPVRPGQKLDAVVGNDVLCRRNPLCPDARYLADRGVYPIAGTSLRLDRLPLQAPKDDDALHTVTVAIFDRSGRRRGEVAWRLEFRVRATQETTR